MIALRRAIHKAEAKQMNIRIIMASPTKRSAKNSKCTGICHAISSQLYFLPTPVTSYSTATHAVKYSAF